MRGETLQVRDRGRHAFATETIERPYEQEVELASRCAGKHRTELLSVLDALTAILMLDVFADDRIAHARAPITELPQLVFGILPFVVCRDAGVYRNSYSHETYLLQPFRVLSREPAISRR